MEGGIDDSDDFQCEEKEDFLDVRYRRAISSGEPSLDGSIDDERNAVSDSETTHAARMSTIAKQAKGPSSDALESECLAENVARALKKKNEWEDVLGSGDLQRRILAEGSGHRPTDDSSVLINVIDTLRGVDSHEGLEFVLGFSAVIDAWELIVKMMRVGEVCQVKSSPRFAHGDIGLAPSIGPNQWQEYTIELVSFSPADFPNMQQEEMIDFLIKMKDRGNFYFSRMEYEKAIFVYKRAVSKGVAEVEVSRDDVSKVTSALYSNLAVSYAKLEEWKASLEAANDSLAVDHSNPKALFRKGQALLRLGEAEEAVAWLGQARVVDPTDAAIAREIAFAKAAVGSGRERERAMARRMLSGISTGEEPRAEGRGWTRRAALAAFACAIFALFVHFLFQL